MKTTSKPPKPFFLYDVVHADGKVIFRALTLKEARFHVKTWNEVVSGRPNLMVHTRKAWRVVPIGGTAVKR